MQLNESLEELLSIFNATIIDSDKNNFVVESSKSLPESINKIAKEVNIAVSTMPQYSLGKTAPQDLSIIGQTSYRYEFRNNAKEALRALLFLATEKERYNKFCEAFDNEVEQELDSKQ